MPFTVHLRDSGLDEETRATAEARYLAKLERTLGGAAQAEETYRQWNALVETARNPTTAEKEFDRRWQEVVRDSITAGLKGLSLPEGFEGYFEIRVTR
jgi:hypothetical protein